MCQRVSERTCDQSYLVPCIFVFTKFGSFSGLNFTVGGPGGPMLAEGGDAVLVAAEPAWKRKACVACNKVGWAEHNKPAQVMCTTCHNQALNASNRKRKVARQEKRVRAAARHAPPPRVILPGNDEHSPELEAQLREIIRWCIDKTRGPSKVPGVDVINGGFVELKIPATHEVPADESEENWTDWQHIITHRQGFDAWYAITEKKEARELCLWRADPPTLAIEYIQELQARTSEALGLHFAGTPFAHHDFSLIMGDKERGAGNTAGQVVHCDVQHPETFGITYVLGGYGTKVANYTTAEHMDLMRKHTSDIGYSIQDITMQSGTTLSRLYASYLSCFQLTEVNVLERTVPVRAEDNSNSDDEPTPSFFQPGTVSLVNGGFAHAASGLSAMHPLRMILFSAGSQLGVESPYQGYEQKLIGEPDVFWAFAARTAAQRAAWLERAKATILRVVTSQGPNYYASKKAGATLPTPGSLFSPLTLHSQPLYLHQAPSTATTGTSAENSPIAKVAYNIKVTQEEMLKRLRGEGTVLNGRGMTAPAEVGFSVVELQRALWVVEALVAYVSSDAAPIIKKLGWQKAHFSGDMKALKDLIKETTAVLTPMTTMVAVAATGRGRGGGKGRGSVKGKGTAGTTGRGRRSGAAKG